MTAAEDARATRLDALLDQVLGSPRRYTRGEVASAAGVPQADARALWRAMGFADVGDDTAFTDADVTALRLVVTLVEGGAWAGETGVDMARSIGRTTARLAEWQVDTFTRLLAAGGRYDTADPLSPESTVALQRELALLLPAVERLVVHGWRRQLAAVLERELATPAGTPDAAVVTVGFADLVGFTRLARHMEVAAVASLVERFEARASDAVAAQGARLVKTLGDEVMFTAADARTAVAVAGELQRAQRPDADAGLLRIGLATGPVVSRRGDVHGTTVNLASRLTASAGPGTVLVDDETAMALGPDGAHVLVRQPPRRLPGLGEVGTSLLDWR